MSAIPLRTWRIDGLIGRLMVSFVKFDRFKTDLAAGVHAAALNADTDTLKIYLSNATPNTATNQVKADLAEITNQNGYTAPVDVQNLPCLSLM